MKLYLGIKAKFAFIKITFWLSELNTSQLFLLILIYNTGVRHCQ